MRDSVTNIQRFSQNFAFTIPVEQKPFTLTRKIQNVILSQLYQNAIYKCLNI